MSDEEEDTALRHDCPRCYGHGCSDCEHRGWIETLRGRQQREEAEEWRAEQRRDDRMRERWER